MSLDSGNYATNNVNYVKQINKPRLNKNNRETRKCFQCGKIGHIKQNCWQLKGQNDKNKFKPKKMNSPYKVNIAENEQKAVGENVTEKRVCTFQSINNQSIANTVALVNDKPIRVHFDTGAEISVMSDKAVRKNGFEIRPSNVKIKGVNRQVVQVIGVTEPLTVRLFLYGTRFTLVTDHSALLYLMSIKDHTGRLALGQYIYRNMNLTLSIKKAKSTQTQMQ
jgi:hypothetical protein